MLFYKYLSFRSGKKLLETCKVAFSRPWDFNDPFELHCAWNDFENTVFGPIAVRKLHETTLMLCLSKIPLNPLMWAHYGSSHKGFVIGLDVEECGWCDERKSTVPCQYGEVTYAKERPSEPSKIGRMDIGNERSYRPELQGRLRQFFLTKPDCWSYEQEVRVVKCASDHEWCLENGGASIDDTIDQAGLSNKKYLQEIPRSAIKEIYLGLCNPCNETACGRDFDITPWLDRARVKCCRLSPTSWDLNAIEYGMSN